MIYYNYIIGNYTGVTKDLTARRSDHKTRQGRDISRLQVVRVSSNEQDALKYEKHLQEKCGYEGKRKSYNAGKNNSFYGKTHTKETRKKLGANKGKAPWNKGLKFDGIASNDSKLPKAGN